METLKVNFYRNYSISIFFSYYFICRRESFFFLFIYFSNYLILFYFILYHIVLFCFILFYFVLLFSILFYFILFYFILFRFVLFYFILFLFCFILFYFILFYFILFYFILFYFILFYFILFYFNCSLSGYLFNLYVLIGVLTAAIEAIRTGKPVEKRSAYVVPWILDSELLSVIPTKNRNANKNDEKNENQDQHDNDNENKNENDRNQDDEITFLCVPNSCCQSQFENSVNEYCCFVFVKYSCSRNDHFYSYEKVNIFFDHI